MLRALCFLSVNPLLQIGILWFGKRCKFKVLECVFVCAVDPRVTGKTAQTLQRLVHHFWCTFKNTAAAAREECVATEQSRGVIVRLFAEIRDMIQCMTGYRNNLKSESTDNLNLIGLTYSGAYAINMTAFWAINRHGIACQQRFQATDMICVVMSYQY